MLLHAHKATPGGRGQIPYKKKWGCSVKNWTKTSKKRPKCLRLIRLFRPTQDTIVIKKQANTVRNTAVR